MDLVLDAEIAMTGTEFSLDANWAAVGVTLLGVILGLAAVWWQARKQWLLHSAQLVTDLVQQFSSLRSQRREFAEFLSDLRQGKDDAQLKGEVEPLSFFENIGYLVRRGALDDRMVWNKFSWVIARYYLALTYRSNLLEEVRSREHEPTLYKEFEWLFENTAELYREAGVHIRDPLFQEERIDQLIFQETK